MSCNAVSTAPNASRAVAPPSVTPLGRDFLRDTEPLLEGMDRAVTRLRQSAGLEQGSLASLVYLSSTRLYDGQGEGVANDTAVLPLDPANPRHLYDFSKGLGESLCHVAGQGRARVARLACVYEGPQDADGFLPALLRHRRWAHDRRT